jgi:epoxyqueuosine reductase QueG
MHAAEKTLILGWNARAPFIINELDQDVSPGSVVKVVANCVEGAANCALVCALKKFSKFEERETTDRRELDALAPQTYGQVVVLAYSDTLNIQERMRAP